MEFKSNREIIVDRKYGRDVPNKCRTQECLDFLYIIVRSKLFIQVSFLQPTLIVLSPEQEMTSLPVAVGENAAQYTSCV